MAESSMVRVELSFRANWYHEGEVDILWCDGGSGTEKSYGTLAQGGTMVRETYEGHRWHARGVSSRALVDALVCTRPSDDGPQRWDIGGTPTRLDPVQASLWRLGRAPRERALGACTRLEKIISNILRAPKEPKYRALRVANATVAELLDAPGVLALLTALGFEQHAGPLPADSAQPPPLSDASPDRPGPRLILGPNAPIGPLEHARQEVGRMLALLRGERLPPPTSTSAAAGASGGGSSSDPSSGASHWCASCACGIRNDVRHVRRSEPDTWRSGGADWSADLEYRAHCETCNVDLCTRCYDKWKEGGNTHAHSHELRVVPPITTPWGSSGLGVAPAPPPVSSRNRRGPWG